LVLEHSDSVQNNMDKPLNLEQVQNQAGLPSLGGLTVGSIISKFLPYIFGAAGIALLVYLVMGGFQLIFAKGDPKAVQGAQAKITNALLGFVIVIISYVLVSLIGQLLGIGAFGSIFKSAGP